MKSLLNLEKEVSVSETIHTEKFLYFREKGSRDKKINYLHLSFMEDPRSF